jgi:hypothetical protein
LSDTYRGIQRQHPRYLIALPMTLMAGDHAVSGVTVNLSLGGALVETAMPAAGAMNVTWSCIQIGDLGEYPCRVVHQTSRRFGLAFLRTPRSEGALARFLAGRSPEA